MHCELCGKKDAKFQAEIEGTLMKVCEDCGRFGKIKGSSNIQYIVKQPKKQQEEPEFIVISGFGQLVKNAREKLGLKQEDMAKKLNEKESLLHNVESEHFKPGIDLARKLEHVLRIKILEEVKSESMHTGQQAKSSLGRTLGDFFRK